MLYSLAAVASPSNADMSGILGGVTSLLGWVTQSMTTICDWVLNDPLAFIYVGLFLVGAAMGFLFRILRSV